MSNKFTCVIMCDMLLLMYMRYCTQSGSSDESETCIERTIVCEATGVKGPHIPYNWFVSHSITRVAHIPVLRIHMTRANLNVLPQDIVATFMWHSVTFLEATTVMLWCIYSSSGIIDFDEVAADSCSSAVANRLSFTTPPLPNHHWLLDNASLMIHL